MQSFLLKTGIFAVLAIGIFFYTLSRADGYTDPFYVRFTTPQQSSMILGTSRAAQGLMPSVFDSILGTEMYNYSFTLGHSPYGKLYLESIKQKIKDSDEPGTFILAVDPWSISSKTENPEDSLNFRENTRELSFPWSVTSKPNYPYLIKALSGNYFRTIYSGNNKRVNSFYLHDDGWLEISISMEDSTLNARTQTRLKTYREEHLPVFQFSKTRLFYLAEIIDFLKKHGKVYLVRLPVHPGMMEIEHELMPDFSEVISGPIKSCDGYLDLTSANLLHKYSDGNHLHKSSAPAVSRQVANWIAATNND